VKPLGLGEPAERGPRTWADKIIIIIIIIIIINNMGGSYMDAYLTGDYMRSIATCCAGGSLRKLKLLGVVGGKVNFGVLSALTIMVSMMLTYMSLGWVDIEGIDQLAGLRQLRLSDSHLLDDTLADVAQHLTHLTELCTERLWLSKQVITYHIYSVRPDRWYDCKYAPSVSDQLTRHLVALGILPAGNP
jgi:hypothetical protein